MICEFWTLSIVMDFLTLVYKVSPIVRLASFGLLVGSHLSWQYWLVVKVALFSAHMIRFGGQPNRQLPPSPPPRSSSAHNFAGVPVLWILK